MANGIAYVVVDLGYGDAGKGTIVDALARKVNAKLVVRFNGGCQAAHNVVLPDGTHHTFSQFGSASFVPGVKTYLSEYFLWNPISMMTEADVLRAKGLGDILERVYVDEHALVVTPWHRAFNRLLEFARGDGRHGSCGEGIGQAVEMRYERASNYSLQAGDLRNRSVEDIAEVLTRSAQVKRDEWLAMMVHPEVTKDFPHEDLKFLLDVEAPLKCAVLYKQIAGRLKFAGDNSDWDSASIGEMWNDNIVFEGAQGILIDETWGFAPIRRGVTAHPLTPATFCAGSDGLGASMSLAWFAVSQFDTAPDRFRRRLQGGFQFKRYTTRVTPGRDRRGWEGSTLWRRTMQSRWTVTLIRWPSRT